MTPKELAKKKYQLAKSIDKTMARAEQKRQSGEDFHKENVLANIMLARGITDFKPISHIEWHTQFMTDPELRQVPTILATGRAIGDTISTSLGLGPGLDFPQAPYTDESIPAGLALGMANTFSHLKIVEETTMPNWVSITPGLLFGLLLTDLENTKGSDVRMPLKSFIIEIPPGAIYNYNKDTGMHEMKYIIVTEAERPGIGRHLFIYTWSQPNENSDHVFDDHAEYFPLDISDDQESLQTFIDVYEELLAEEAEKGFFKDITMGTIFGEEFEGPGFRERILRIVVNTILYLSSYNPSIQSVHQDEIEHLKAKLKGKKKKKLSDAKKLKKLEEDPHYIIGTDITITRDDVKEYQKSHEPREGRKLSRPTITKGHWKMQAYGPGYSKHRLRWIRPYIRGKELGAVVTPHTYHIDENPIYYTPWTADRFIA